MGWINICQENRFEILKKYQIFNSIGHINDNVIINNKKNTDDISNMKFKNFAQTNPVTGRNWSYTKTNMHAI